MGFLSRGLPGQHHFQHQTFFQDSKGTKWEGRKKAGGKTSLYQEVPQVMKAEVEGRADWEKANIQGKTGTIACFEHGYEKDEQVRGEAVRRPWS